MGEILADASLGAKIPPTEMGLARLHALDTEREAHVPGVGRCSGRQQRKESRSGSPLCSDLWADVWRRKVAKGEVIVVRYADDLVVGFQHPTDAERFLREFRERLAKFGLELHPDKN
jgi:hypothetical protein